MSDDREHRVVYVSHPGSGLARSNFPLVCHVAGSRIVRSLPFQIPDDVRLYEIKTSRGTYTRPRKDVQMPLAYAWKPRIHPATRVKSPPLRDDWSPDAQDRAARGLSGSSVINWDRALDIVVGQLGRI